MYNIEVTLFSSVDHFLYHSLIRHFPKWITPNHLTVFRFVTIPFLIFLLVSEQYGLAIPLFVVSALSDAFDGALARQTNQVTEWGKIFDPLADKLLIGSVAGISMVRFLGVGITSTIIGIELLLILTAWYKRYVQKKKIEAGKIGKMKMVLQSVGVGLLLVYAVYPSAGVLNAVQIILVAAIICAIGSLFTYNSV